MHTATDDEDIDQLIHDTPRTAISIPGWTSIRHPTGSPVAMPPIRNLMAVTRTRKAHATYVRNTDRSNERGHKAYKVLRAQARYLSGLGWDQRRIAAELDFRPRCVIDALALAGPASKDKLENDSSFVDDAFRAKYAVRVSPLKSSAKRKDAVAQVPKNPSATEGHGLRSASSINGTSTAVTPKEIRDCEGREGSRSTTDATPSLSPTATPKRTRDDEDKGVEAKSRKRSKKSKCLQGAPIPRLTLRNDLMDTDDIPLSRVTEGILTRSSRTYASRNTDSLAPATRDIPSIPQVASPSNSQEDPFSTSGSALSDSTLSKERAAQKRKRKSEKEKRRAEKEEKRRAQSKEQEEIEERERLRRLAEMADAMVQELNSSREASSLESSPAPASLAASSPRSSPSPGPSQISTPDSALSPPPPSLSQDSEIDPSQVARRTCARARAPDPSPQYESPVLESVAPPPAACCATATTPVVPVCTSGCTGNLKIHMHASAGLVELGSGFAQAQGCNVHGHGCGQQGITIVVPGEICMKGIRVTVEPFVLPC